MKHSRAISIAAALAAVLPGAALAAPGDPLGDFGDDGKVRTSLAPDIQYSGATAIARAGDGYVVAGLAVAPEDPGGLGGPDTFTAILRYTATGELDPSFSEDGKLLIPGRVPAAGVVTDAAGNVIVGGAPRGGSELVALAVRADGTVDTTFSGDGVATFDLGTPVEANTFDRSPDGRLMFGGRIGNRAHSDLFVAKLEPDGEPATGFSGDGVARIDVGAREQGGRAASDEASGAWIVGQSRNEVAIARLKPSGALDRRFSDDGKRLVTGVLPVATARAVAADGKGAVISVDGAASKPNRTAQTIMRVNGDGSIDRGYGRDGFARLGRSGFTKRAPAVFVPEIAVDRKGRALIGGSAARPNNDSGSEFGVARFTAAGRLDRSFGRRGRVATDLGATDVAYALLVERDRIIAAGQSCVRLPGDDPESTCDTALAGYEG